jgi:hypothetical protein
LMVKVAPLLPSRDLLSSHSQISWTHTRGLPQGWQDVVSFIILSLSASVPAGHSLFSFLLLPSSSKYINSFCSGLTVINASPAASPERWQ